jgi:hypothetical protein
MPGLAARAIDQTDEGRGLHAGLALTDAADREADADRLFAGIQDRIAQYRRAGWRVPQELIRIERQLMAEFLAEAED